MTVNSKEDNSKDFCPICAQGFSLCIVASCYGARCTVASCTDESCTGARSFWDFEDRIDVSWASNSIGYAVEGTGISTYFLAGAPIGLYFLAGINLNWLNKLMSESSKYYLTGSKYLPSK